MAIKGRRKDRWSWQIRPPQLALNCKDEETQESTRKSLDA